ncbi:uncharacterized protein [Montipora foliosa]|uniref:uncharacterized protein n=1 Tax=Montipora foliosa TaxID=591990 RepID=UPI0035F12DD6
MSEVSTQFMSWRELTDVLTARDLPLRPSCRKARLVAMAVVKAILSFYRSGEEKPVERYKTRVKVTEEHKLLSSCRKNVIEFLGINEQAQKFGLGSYELKLWRLVKSNGKTAENLGITTQQQLDLELPFLLGSEGESELNVHVVQSVIQWGKNPVVVIKQQDDHVKSVKKSKPQNAKDGSTKRKSRQDAKDDRLLIKKLKEDDAMAVRSDRQQSELRALNAELEKLKGSTAINEAKLKCGLCCKSYSVPLDRKTAGKVSFFKTTHFNECQKKRAGVKGVRTLENFFAKAAAQRLPEPTSSILPVSN